MEEWSDLGRAVRTERKPVSRKERQEHRQDEKGGRGGHAGKGREGEGGLSDFLGTISVPEVFRVVGWFE